RRARVQFTRGLAQGVRGVLAVPERDGLLDAVAREFEMQLGAPEIVPRERELCELGGALDVVERLAGQGVARGRGDAGDGDGAGEQCGDDGEAPAAARAAREQLAANRLLR